MYYPVNSVDGEIINTCARYNSKSLEIVSESFESPFFIKCTPAIRKSLYEALSKRGLEFGVLAMCLYEKYVPKSNDLVKFENSSNNITGCGIVKNITKSGIAEMYCYYIEQGEELILKYGMNEDIGDSKDYSFTPLESSSVERRNLEKYLNNVGKSWNGYVKRVEPAYMKVGKDEKYYYISDNLRVVEATEHLTKKSGEKYLSGNYFRNMEDALNILSGINQIIREKLCK